MLSWHSGGNKSLTETFKFTKKMYKHKDEGNLKIMRVNKHKIKCQMPRKQVERLTLS